MMKSLLASMVIASLSGCALAPKSPADVAKFNEVVGAARDTTVVCSSELQCAKALKLTKAYIGMKSDMKIQFSDDTGVHTYLGSTSDMSMGARLVPGIGDGGTITLSARCDHLRYAPDPSFYHCADKMLDALRGYKPFVQARL